jgi:HK97 family phage prohead protease
MDRIEVKFATDQVDGQTGEFSGYGAVFGNKDSHGDVITPGAFTASLDEWKARGRWPAMKMMHGSAANPFTGSDKPIGVYASMHEDQKGLYVKGKISGLNTDEGRYNYELVKDGALNALSIGFKAVRFERGNAPDVKRLLQQVKLFEVSLVPDGSNDRALIDSIKSAEGIKTIRDFEEFLRDVGGFSNAAAKAIASGGFKASEPRDEDEADIAALVLRNIAVLTER